MKNILSMFIIFLSIFTIGFAFLSTEVKIDGVGTIDKANWNVRLENVRTNDDNSIVLIDDTSLSYEFNLKHPGDYFEFYVDIVNAGSIDAMIDSIDNKIYLVNNKESLIDLPDYLSYSISYLDGSNIKKYELLSVGSKKTFKIRVEYKRDISSSNLPNESIRLKFNSSIYYVQSDEKLM